MFVSIYIIHIFVHIRIIEVKQFPIKKLKMTLNILCLHSKNALKNISFFIFLFESSLIDLLSRRVLATERLKRRQHLSSLDNILHIYIRYRVNFILHLRLN